MKSIGIGQIRPTTSYGNIVLIEKRPNRRYLVRFEDTGAEREAAESSIRKGNVKDYSLDTTIKVGNLYPTSYYGMVEIMEKLNKDIFVIKFVDTGTIREAYAVAIHKGNVKDPSKPKALYGAIRIGNTYQSNKHGFFKVLDYKDKLYTIEFMDTGYQRKVDRTSIVKGAIRDLSNLPTKGSPLSGALVINVGQAFTNKRGHRYTVIHIFNSSTITVKFDNTGTEKVVYAQSIRTGQVWDCMEPKYQGIGYYGSYDKTDKILQRLWHGVLTRHVSDKFTSTVVPEWLNFSVFTRDVKTLVNYEEWYSHQRDFPEEHSLYHFDKDLRVFGNTVYGPNTCMFITGKDNIFEKDLRGCMNQCEEDSKEWVILKSLRESILDKYLQSTDAPKACE